jgi:hypothetical protein
MLAKKEETKRRRSPRSRWIDEALQQMELDKKRNR